MVKNFYLLKINYLIILMLLIGCTKNNSENFANQNLEIITHDQVSSNLVNLKSINKIKWGKNEDDYLASLKKHSLKFKRNTSIAKVTQSTLEQSNFEDEEPEPVNLVCNSSNPNIYGYYDDPEDLIVEGSYVSANSLLQESQISNCNALLSTVSAARIYLISEGYSDIATIYDNSNNQLDLIHAANTLVDLKNKMLNNGNQTSNSRIANCILQAIGYAAIAELSANWATASRQVIIKAVGKIAQRYLGWVGAAIAVSSFVDCMWFS